MRYHKSIWLISLILTAFFDQVNILKHIFSYIDFLHQIRSFSRNGPGIWINLGKSWCLTSLLNNYNIIPLMCASLLTYISLSRWQFSTTVIKLKFIASLFDRFSSYSITFVMKSCRETILCLRDMLFFMID